MSRPLSDRKVLLAITGGIAAYKSAELCRLLIKQGASVRVVMTAGAQEFISPLTFQALSGNPVHTTLLDPQAEAGMGHIELAKWPDLIVVAPATANMIARYRVGCADDLLSTILLATIVPVAIVPAMNQAMWLHPSTQENVQVLQSRSNTSVLIWGPQSGEQACGDLGPGRMLEPQEICQRVERFFASGAGPLANKRIVITAGPTREALDPVRYITNHSSGKMGYALADVCRSLGAEVVLVSGPCALAVPEHVKRISVTSAEEMLVEVERELSQGCDIFIASAAVADYRPSSPSGSKLKKQGEEMHIELTRNPDIVASVASRADRPFVVGFAAETNDVVAYARGKLKNKNLDMIVANDVSVSGIGFNSDENEVHIIWQDGDRVLPRQSKTGIAKAIVEEIITQLNQSMEESE